MQMRMKRLQKELEDNKRIEECAMQFGVTGDKTRLKICYLLCHHSELSVTEISETIGSPISTVSHSLNKLKEAGVVSNRRSAKTVYYSFKKSNFVTMLKKQLLT